MPRRRRSACLLASGLAVAGVVAVGAGGTAGAAPARRAAGGTTVSRAQLAEAGRLLLVSIPGPSLDPVTRLLVSRDQVGGVVLFGRNITGDAQLRALDAGLHAAAGRRGFVVSVDQEGGTVRRVTSAQPFVSARQAAALGPRGVRALMSTAGRELRALGVDVDLAPVSDQAGGFLGTRSYGAQPAADVAAAVLGLQSAGVRATAKHFPGLGGVTTNTDDAPAAGRPVTAAALAPFAAAVKAHVGLVLVDLANHPGLGDGPAALQPATYALLRGPRVGFTGPAITDALDAGAVARAGEVRAAVLALRAGADLVTVTGGPVVDQEVLAAVTSAVRAGTLPAGRYLDALRQASALEAVSHGPAVSSH